MPDTTLSHLFAATVLQARWPDVADLNAELRDLILSRRGRCPGVHQSNVGGWQSQKDLPAWPGPAVTALMSRIEATTYLLVSALLGAKPPGDVTRWIISAWANVNEAGHYNMVHCHAGAVWSGVYFVDPGDLSDDHPTSGFLTFRSPHMGAVAVNNVSAQPGLAPLFPADYSVRPEGGLAIAFPGWLDHVVHPYYGARPRISVSWDVRYS